MEKKINRNIFWSELFFAQLNKFGVKQAVICPGSRSTSLVFGLVKQNKIKIFNLVDERSAAFFALGIAKQTKSPVAIVTTSGTAVAELYPAIIEAYQERIPLIICTADRPPELINCGANQTINQKNIFANHIRYFFEAEPPRLQKEKIKKLLTLTKKALSIALYKDRGPVHINLPFRKPFEPDQFTDVIESQALKDFRDLIIKPDIIGSKTKPKNHLASELFATERGLIFFNVKNPTKNQMKSIDLLSSSLKFPIIDDGTSSIRFNSKLKSHVIRNASNFLKYDRIRELINPQVILQFDDAPISNSQLDYFEKTKCKKYLINEFGDVKDPSKTYNKIFSMNAEQFCSGVLSHRISNCGNTSFQSLLKNIDTLFEEFKTKFMSEVPFNFEGKFLHEVIKLLPDKTSLFLSNSMPVRDFDSFTNRIKNNITIHTNRGASGIDGITSTALGIASQAPMPTVLIAGDLAFYHDMNGLLASSKFNIPLTIVLINNNGGGIFEMLPVSKHRKVLNKNFLTPTNLNFQPFVEGYSGEFYSVNNLEELSKYLRTSLNSGKLSVIEIKTDSKASAELRRNFLADSINSFETRFNEDKL